MPLRAATRTDVPAILKLQAQSPEAASWSQQQYESMFFDRDARPASGRFVWVVEDELTEAAGGLTIEHPELLAFLVARRIGAEWELENIAVAPSARRHGFGALLLRKLIGEASAANGESIFLEMRKSNLGARSLYRKFGFREQGLRKSYYSDPPEDAILYRLVLN